MILQHSVVNLLQFVDSLLLQSIEVTACSSVGLEKCQTWFLLCSTIHTYIGIHGDFISPEGMVEGDVDSFFEVGYVSS